MKVKPKAVSNSRQSNVHPSPKNPNRQQTEESLREYQTILATAEEVAKIGSWKWDLRTQKVTWSDEMFRLFGVEREGFDGDVNRIVAERIHPEDAVAVTEANRRVLEEANPVPLSYRIVLPNATERTVWAQGKLIRDKAGKAIALTGYVQDITERVKAEKKIMQLKRLYATLSQINQMIVRVREPGELYRTICDVAVQFGELTLAWVGLLNEDSGEVKPVAANGLDIDQWPFQKINIHYEVHRQSLAFRAIRTSKVTINENVQENKYLVNLNSNLSSYPYRATAVIPFRLRNKVIGIVMLVSRENGVFNDKDEIRLLEEMGLDISFALDTMENEKERKQAEEAIRSRSRQLEVLLNVSRSLTESLNLPEVLQRITDKVADMVEVETSAIYLVNDESLYLGASTPPLRPDMPEEFRIAELKDHPHIAEALASRKIISLPDAQSAFLTAAEQEIRDNLSLRTIHYIPVIAKQKSVGVLILGSVSSPREFSANEISMANAVSSQAALAITNAKLYEDLARQVKELETQITERRKVEDALRNNEALLSEAQHIGHIGHWQWTAPGTDLLCSKELFHIFEKPWDESSVISRNEISAMLSPEEKRRLQQLDHEAIVNRANAEYEYRIQLPSGKSRWLHQRMRMTYGEDGKFVHMMGIVQDISERKKAEESLRQSEHVLRLFVEHSPASIAMFDRDMRYIVASERYLVDYDLPPQDLTGRSHYEVFPEIPERWKEIHRRCLNGAIEKADEDPFPRASGKLDWVRWEIRPWYEEPGKVGGIILFSEVITERKMIQDELRHLNDVLEQRVLQRTMELSQANRAKDEFLANMSHELRTPLNTVLGLSESLLEQRRGPLNEKQVKSIELISASGQHLLGLINDILEVSKIEAGKLDLHPCDVSLKELCESSLNFIKELALKKRITVDFNNETSISKFQADPQRLKQILINLLTNAVKFTPEKGRVSLEVRTNAEADRILFSVTDTGIGIAAEDLKKLFTPFTQLDSSLSRQYAGTGLGLALVQKLTELHGGSVEVASDVDQGSRFTIILPLNQSVQEPTSETIVGAANIEQKLACGPTMPKELGTILLAEDNDINSSMLSEYLTVHGYYVVTAKNGEEVLEKAAGFKPDLVLMDIQMPKMDGLAATRHLRSDPQFLSTPIIALTALAMPGDKERCLEAGVNEYMSKPVRLKTLLGMIEKLMKPES